MRPVLVPFSVALLSAAAAGGEPTPSPALIVLNKADNAMAIINPANGKVVATIPMGRSPHEAAVEPRPDEFHWAPFLKELSEFRLSYPRVAAAVPEGKAQESW